MPRRKFYTIATCDLCGDHEERDHRTPPTDDYTPRRWAVIDVRSGCSTTEILLCEMCSVSFPAERVVALIKGAANATA